LLGRRAVLNIEESRSKLDAWGFTLGVLASPPLLISIAKLETVNAGVWYVPVVALLREVVKETFFPLAIRYNMKEGVH